ncbi:MAG: O-antigen ligase family protein [Candidatus Wallbacteria bacterium]|nr:O-antigen ligase family protein [Candidatus Wallbacteria bacterium]
MRDRRLVQGPEDRLSAPFWGVAGLAAAGPLLASVNTVAWLAAAVAALATAGAAALWRGATIGAQAAFTARIWVAWLVFLVASLAWAPCFHGSALGAAKLLAIHLAAMGIAFSPSLRARNAALLTTCLAVALVIALFGLQEVAAGKEMLPGWVDPAHQSSIRTRAASTLANPNLLAGYLALWLPVASGCALDAGSPVAPIATVVVLFAALLFTFSRGGWLGAAAGTALFLWLARRHPKAGRLKWVLASSLAVCVLAAPQLMERTSSAGRSGELGVQQRFLLWAGVLDCIRERPLVGSGFNSFETAYPRCRKVGGYYPLDAHNDLLHLAVEAGLPGALLYALLLAAVVFAAFRARAGEADGTGAGLAAGLLGAIVASFFMGSIRYLGMQVPFWFAAALAMARSHPSPGGQGKLAARLPAASLLLAAAATLYWVATWATDPSLADGQRPTSRMLQARLAWMPWRHELRLIHARLLAAEGNSQAALEELKRAQSLDPLQGDYDRWQARVLAGSDRPQEALEAIDRALAADPMSEEYLLLKGRLLARLGRLADAAAALERALETNEQYLKINTAVYPRVFEELTALYGRMGRAADRAATEARARALYPEEPALPVAITPTMR